ncbi:MAG: amidohydrolase [Cellulosilyticaceae bacterium]
MKTIIKNIRIITMNENMEEIQDGFVIIEDDKINDIGKMDEYKETDGEMIDGKGGILMPGMINTHTHLSMIPFRSLGDDCKDRLRRYLFPLENKCMNERLAYYSAKYAICELLLGGVTTLMDMYYFEDSVAQAAEEMGIRAFLGETVINFPTCDSEVAHGGLGYAEAFISKWKGHELITPFIAPHAPNTNSTEALVSANEISKKHQVPITMHTSEMDYEMEYFRQNYNQTPLEYLESIGLLSDRLVAAHCIFLTEKDIELMKKYEVKVAHCIGSNTKAAKGVAPIRKVLEAGIPVGLGSDGASSGNTLDIITQFKLFANFHKLENKDRGVFPAQEIIKLGTITGAKVLNKEQEIGSIEVGKKADLVLIETESVNMFPVFDPYSAIVYSANASNVDTVFVNGKCLVKNKQLIDVELRRIREELQHEMKEFEARAKEQLEASME